MFKLIVISILLIVTQSVNCDENSSEEDTPDCSDGFNLIGTRCVHLCMAQKRSLYETKKYCKEKQAKLIKVRDDGDNDALKKLIGDGNWGWIGANVTFETDEEGVYEPSIVYFDGTSDYTRKYSTDKCNWNGCCIKLSGSTMETDWEAADCRRQTAFALCEKQALEPDSSEDMMEASGNGIDGEAKADLTANGQNSSGESEEDEDESYSPDECLNKMRGDIHDMIALIQKIKEADPTIRFELDNEYVLITNALNGTVLRVVN